MKKFFILIGSIISFASTCMAQDVISLIDGQKINADVTEVAPDHIKFKYFHNLNGPTYMLQKKDIISIRFQDGKMVVFPVPGISTTPPSASDVIITIDGQRINAKVTEIGIDLIKFKYADNLTGPVYAFQKKDIASIQYQNGKVDTFQQQNPTNNLYQPQNQSQEVIQLPKATSSDEKEKFTVGLRIGFNLTNMTSTYDGIKQTANYLPGFQVGIVGSCPITKNFAIQPGVLFATQGARLDYSDDEGERMKGSTNLNYIQVPINAQIRIGSKKTGLLLQAGPYVGYAIVGKSKWESILEGATEKYEQKIEFGSDEEKVNPFDYGLGLGIGLNLNNIQIGFGYNLGLANLANFANASTKNSGFALTFTYLFGKKP